jgi:hypothetical protein
MLSYTNLPKEFWRYAVLMKTYLINRSPHKKMQIMKPYEAWTGCRPNISNLIGNKRLNLDISRQITVANDLLDADNGESVNVPPFHLTDQEEEPQPAAISPSKSIPVDTNIANIQLINVDIVDEIDKHKLITAGEKAKTRRPNQIRQTEALLMLAAMEIFF